VADISQDEHDELVRPPVVGEIAEWGEDTVVRWPKIWPSRIYAYPDDPDLPYEVHMEIVATPDGVHEIERLVVERRPGGPAVTASGLRAVHVAMLLRDAVDRWEQEPHFDPSAGTWVSPVPTTTTGKRRGPTSKITDVDLPAVAAAYRQGREGHRGTEAVRETFGVSRSTAHRAVRRAVDAGHLTEDEIERPNEETNR
jgi:hypothetical protein